MVHNSNGSQHYIFHPALDMRLLVSSESTQQRQPCLLPICLASIFHPLAYSATKQTISISAHANNLQSNPCLHVCFDSKATLLSVPLSKNQSLVAKSKPRNLRDSITHVLCGIGNSSENVLRLETLKASFFVREDLSDQDIFLSSFPPLPFVLCGKFFNLRRG